MIILGSVGLLCGLCAVACPADVLDPTCTCTVDADCADSSASRASLTRLSKKLALDFAGSTCSSSVVCR